MQYKGVVIHHSVCPSINGRGYDFYITKQGQVIPASEQTDPSFVHICLEGDFAAPEQPLDAERQEQLFLLHKLILRLARIYGFSPEEVAPHNDSCPSGGFPWAQLVISPEDRYH